MSRQYNSQGIHRAEKELDKASRPLKKYGGKYATRSEIANYIKKKDELAQEHEKARENERLSKSWSW